MSTRTTRKKAGPLAHRITGVPVARLVQGDDELVHSWLHGKSANTQAAYTADLQRFRRFIGPKPLDTVGIADLQGYADTLADLRPLSQARALRAVKSLLSYGQKLGYLRVNVGAGLQVPKDKDTLAERILTETEVQRILALESDPRNRVLLRLLYASGARVSELCGLKWKDCIGREDDAGQVTLYGKREKTRAVLLSEETWAELAAMQGDAGPDDPVFRSDCRREGATGHLHRSQVNRIVSLAARRAGLDTAVSPHWFRHAHASHALDRGCPINTLQATLGHANVSTTSRYIHARPNDSSARYLGV